MDARIKKNNLVAKFVELRRLSIHKGLNISDIESILKDPFKLKRQIPRDEKGKVQVVANEKANTKTTSKYSNGQLCMRSLFLVALALGVISSILFSYIGLSTIVDTESIDRCLVDQGYMSKEMTRPMPKCDFCRSVYDVAIERNLSSKTFQEKYAYSAKPVLIKEATEHWSAISNFSFQFFKDLYQNTEGALTTIEEECQFFGYKTNFTTLGEVFNISEARANFAAGEETWYIGWSNCHKEVKEELRKHYERPYFLPSDSESSNLDWIFMGGSGPGALIHIDYVQKPSWQAQISGKKTWTLIPPPECEAECRALNVTVHKGDIFVVDTNLWYHSTFIHPGEISITIGSEYD